MQGDLIDDERDEMIASEFISSLTSSLEPSRQDLDSMRKLRRDPVSNRAADEIESNRPAS